MPNDGAVEVAWAEDISAAGKYNLFEAYVASCDLINVDVEEELKALV